MQCGSDSALVVERDAVRSRHSFEEFAQVHQKGSIPSLSLAGKTALVTGASSGLGRHFGKVLAAAGAKVVLGARRLDRLNAVAEDIRGAGGEAYGVVLDVTSSASVVAAFEDGETHLGPISVVVNNAGIPSQSYFLKMSEDEWRGVLDVNLDGVFRVGQEGAKRMARRGEGGTIINIASVMGFGVLKTLAPYAVSKAGVIQLTKAMALELARDGIRVNALAPGYVTTEMNDDFLTGEAGRKLLAKVPMTRAGELPELDGPLLLLASDAGSYMTGSVITVDGGTLLSMG
jgi:NAD(P)-dependent dehydrogenase (short-subunit alcohol dehydrogenase family)